MTVYASVVVIEFTRTGTAATAGGGAVSGHHGAWQMTKTTHFGRRRRLQARSRACAAHLVYAGIANSGSGTAVLLVRPSEKLPRAGTRGYAEIWEVRKSAECICTQTHGYAWALICMTCVNLVFVSRASRALAPRFRGERTMFRGERTMFRASPAVLFRFASCVWVTSFLPAILFASTCL